MALQGTLDTFGLPDVLRLLASTHKTGRLEVRAERGTGTVWLDGGALVAAESSATAMVDDMVRVVFELLRHRNGLFNFEAAEQLELAGVPRDVDEVVGAAERTLAEWRAVEALVPSLEAWVSLAEDLPDPEVVLDATRWRTVVAIGAGAQVGAVGDDLGLGEVETCQAVAELVSAGLAVIGEIPAELLGETAPPAPGHVAVAHQSGLRVEAPSGFQAAGTGAPRPAPTANAAVNPAAVASAASPAPAAAVTMVDPATASAAPDPAPSVVAPFGADAIDPADATNPADADPAWQGDWLGRSDLEPQPESAPEPIIPTEPVVTPAAPAEPRPAPMSGSGNLGIVIPGLPSLSSRWDTPEEAPTVDDGDEVSVELGPLTPMAARAIAMAAQATSEAERESAIAQAIEANDQPLDRGVLLRFLSSVRGN